MTTALHRPRAIGAFPAASFYTGCAVDALGTGAGAGCVVLYFVTVVGLDAAAISVAMSIGALVGVGGPMLAGSLADAFGVRRIYVVMLVCRAAAVSCYAVVDSYVGFFVVSLAVLGLETTTFPLQQSLIATGVPSEHRVRVLTSVRAIRAAFFGLGALAAAAAVASSNVPAIRAALLANGVSFLVLAFVIARIPIATSNAHSSTVDSPRKGRVFRDPPFLCLCASNGVVSLYDTVIYLVMPIWVVAIADLSPLVVGVLLALYTTLGVVLQLSLARRPSVSDPERLRPVAVAIPLLAACGLFAISPAGAAGWQRIMCCIFAVASLAAAENLHVTGSWRLVLAISPGRYRSQYAGAFSTGLSIQAVVGPILLVAAVYALGSVAWLGLGLVLAAAALLFWRIGKRRMASQCILGDVLQ